MATLDEFLAPLDATAFRRDYFGNRPVHVPRGDAPCPDILNWDRFNRTLGVGAYWTEDSLKLYFKGRAALRENYCDLADGRGRAAPINPAKVQALILLGASVVANHIHRVSAEVARFVRMFELEFGARSFANVYCSFKNVQAFQTHYDLHDVFAFQAEGEKVWRVYEARENAPVAPIPPGDAAEKRLIDTRGALLFEALMKPGDVLYLPRGQYHEAMTASDASLHVTFGVSPATGLALFDLLKSACLAESSFRAYLPDARDASKLQDHLEALAQRVGEMMASPAFAIDVLNHQRGLGNAHREFQLPERGVDTWYAVENHAQIVRRADDYWFIANGRQIALGSTYPIFEWLLAQRRVSRGELLARLPCAESELDSVLAKLMEAGAIVEVEMR